ncbi:MAG: single-stranded DNA-binding protein [Patescibacteria group bacterium]|jgi:single-strand DNA-binding protein
MDLNRATLIGNLTRDPEVRNTPSGTPVASFSIATNYAYTDQSGQKVQKADFHNIVAWKRLAEICGQYLKKGSKIYVDGRIQNRDWTSPDGVRHYRTEIVMENMIMLSSSGGSSFQGGTKPSYNAPHPTNQTEQPFTPAEPTIDIDAPVYSTPATNGAPEEEEIKVENIPF